MTFTTFMAGTTAKAAEMNTNLDYIGLVSQLGVVTQDWLRLDNVFFDDFTSDTSTLSTNIVYNTTTDSWSTDQAGNPLLTLTPQDQDLGGLGEPFQVIYYLNEGFAKFNYQFFGLYDECNDSTVDATLWGSVHGGGDDNSLTESTQNLLAKTKKGTGAYPLLAKLQTDSTNGNFYGTDAYVMGVSWKGYSNGDATGLTTFELRLIDNSSNSVTLHQAFNSSSTDRDENAQYVLKFNSGTDEVSVWCDGVSIGDIDVSSLTGNVWRLQVYTNKAYASGAQYALDYVSATCYFLRKILSTTPVSTVTEYLSVDSDANWEEVGKGGATGITNTEFNGTYNAKLTATMDANEVLVIGECTYGAWQSKF